MADGTACVSAAGLAGAALGGPEGAATAAVAAGAGAGAAAGAGGGELACDVVSRDAQAQALTASNATAARRSRRGGKVIGP